jgi:hypothetical protein
MVRGVVVLFMDLVTMMIMRFLQYGNGSRVGYC